MPGVTLSFRAAMLFAFSALSVRAQVSVNGRVADENGVAVEGARVELRSPASTSGYSSLSSQSGQFTLELAAAGEYRLASEREGYFRLNGGSINLKAGQNELTVTLNHLREFTESVDVVYSPPAIDLDQPSERAELNTVEILTVPYPAPQDVRNAFPLFNGVVQDTAGRVHVAGGATEQTNYTLNGFNISDPATGRFDARLNIDAVRSLDLETSRFSADKGRASAGSVNVETKMGDDRWSFGGTNFIPGVSTEGGFHLSKWTPRVEVSGPVARGRAWFHNGFDAFYGVNTIPGLPDNANRSRGITLNDLGRFQVNLTPSNILTASLLTNYTDDRRTGLSFLDPAETTTNRSQRFYLWSVKDQVYFGGGGALAEFGFADSRNAFRQSPQGNQIYQITPFGNRGNYFADRDTHSYRQQGLANVILPVMHLLGSHQLKAGLDFERESFHQEVLRHPYQVLRTDLSISRFVTFSGSPFQRRRNFEGAQYAMDRWTPREGFTVEAGVRADWDEVVRDVLWSPRVSAAWAPRFLRDTKISGGYGIFYDSLNLTTLSQHQDQVSFSTFYNPGGLLTGGPVETAFMVNDRRLRVPRFRTASLTVERRLPFHFYGKAAWTRRTGDNGFTFVNQFNTANEGGMYLLENWRHDRYHAVQLSVRRTIGRFEWSAGYTRSLARTDAAVDYSLETPVFGRQGPGPLPWDTPNRFLMWGWAPVPKRPFPGWLRAVIGETDAVYLVEYRTGFPFTVVDDQAIMVGPPNGRRYPDYFNVNLHFERRFRALHYLWAWRFGMNNLTNNSNPNAVNNNIDSPYFLAYGRGQLRAFSVRLRLLGRK